MATIFIDLQSKRHEADYDPFSYVKNRRHMEVILADAEKALDSLEKLSSEEKMLVAARIIGRSRNRS